MQTRRSLRPFTLMSFQQTRGTSFMVVAKRETQGYFFLSAISSKPISLLLTIHGRLRWAHSSGEGIFFSKRSINSLELRSGSKAGPRFDDKEVT